MTEPEELGRRAARGAAWSGVSTIVLRLGGVIVGIVLARLLTPEQFGVYAIALTVQGILMAVADLGLSADLIRSKDPERIAPTIATFGLISGSILTVITVASSGHLAALMGSPEAAGAIAVLGLTLLLAGVSLVPYGMLMRRFQQRELFIISLVDFTISTVVTLALIAAGLGVMALAIGRVAAQVASSTLQFVFAKRLPRFGLARSELRGILAFGLPIAGANLLGWILLNVDNIILARIAGATALGYYVLAFNVASWPMSALAQVVRSSVLPYVARARDSANALPALAGLIWAGALPAGAALAALSGPIISVIYGEKWLPSVPVLAALGLYGSLRVAFDIFAGYLYARGISRSVLWLQLISLVALVAGMLVATPRYGILGAAWVHVAVALVFILPGYLFVLRSTGVSVTALLRACLRPTLATIPAVVVALAADSLIESSVVALLVGGFGAVLAYLAVMGRWLLSRLRTLRSGGGVTDPRAEEPAVDQS